MVLFFSGFLTSASWYQQTADDVAGAGYAVVQYDGPPPWWASQLLDQLGLRYPMVTDLNKEVAVFEPLMAALHAGLLPWVAESGAKVPTGLMNTQKVFVAGHSRGGALASLVLSGLKGSTSKQYKLLGAYLLDPVGPASVGNVLLKSKLPVGITPANTSGLFNFSLVNYKHFYSKADGSSLDVIEEIDGYPSERLTHMMFCDGGPTLNGLMEWLEQLSYNMKPEAMRALVEEKGVEALVLEAVLSAGSAAAPPSVCGTADGASTSRAAGLLSAKQEELNPLQKELLKLLHQLKDDFDGAAAQGSSLAAPKQAAGGIRARAVAEAPVDPARAATAEMVSANMLSWFAKVSAQRGGA